MLLCEEMKRLSGKDNLFSAMQVKLYIINMTDWSVIFIKDYLLINYHISEGIVFEYEY